MTDLSLSEAFVQGIIDGRFDAELPDISAAVMARKKSIAVAASMSIRVGDRVELNERISPKYLRGLVGSVVSKEGTSTARVQLDAGQYTGRYSKSLKVPTEVLDKIEQRTEVKELSA